MEEACLSIWQDLIFPSFIGQARRERETFHRKREKGAVWYNSDLQVSIFLFSEIKGHKQKFEICHWFSVLGTHNFPSSLPLPLHLYLFLISV
ncbi:hypothetical protein RIF29_40000 [Crotalaria pallida]|uniref:Uncharacterized protein n=1 Tax=Crotalaria pallida TaxID=3830 RepID=A0AAN9E2U4_CROPI